MRVARLAAGGGSPGAAAHRRHPMTAVGFRNRAQGNPNPAQGNQSQSQGNQDSPEGIPEKTLPFERISFLPARSSSPSIQQPKGRRHFHSADAAFQSLTAPFASGRPRGQGKREPDSSAPRIESGELAGRFGLQITRAQHQGTALASLDDTHKLGHEALTPRAPASLAAGEGIGRATLTLPAL
jgi:hypothetical protein